MSSRSGPRPSRSRYVVLALLTLHYANTYMDRMAIAGVAPWLRAELDLDEVELGLVFTAFTVGYAAFQLPWGLLADRYGPRRVLTLLVCLWSSMTIGTALATRFGSLLLVRLMFGAAEAGAFPAATRSMSRWFPPDERGLVQGVTHAGSRIGGAITLPLVALIVGVAGWRAVFLAFGAMGLLWAAVWYAWYRDEPAEHPRANAAELQRIGAVHTTSELQPHQPAIALVRVAMRNPNLRWLCLMYGGVVYTAWIYQSWLPTYLVEARGFGMFAAGFWASIPLWAGAVANTLGGWWSDRRARQRGLRAGRRDVATFALVGTVICLCAGALIPNPWLALGLLSLAAAGIEATVSVAWATAMDIGGEASGSVSALMNTCGSIGGAASPLVFGLLVARTGHWALPFLLAAGLCTLSVFAWQRIDPGSAATPLACPRNCPK